MGRAMKTSLYYAGFLALSIAVHAVLVLGPRRVSAAPDLSDLVKEVDLTLKALQPPPPPPPPPEEPKEGDPPKYKETPKEAEEPKPEPEPAKPVEPEKPEPAPPEPVVPKEPKPPPDKPEPPKPEPPKADIRTLAEYRRFLAKEMDSGAKDRAYVPKIRFADNPAAENREIMRYFGMELIAFPPSQSYYVYIDPEQGLYSKSSDFEYLKNFSNRVIFRTSPWFDALRREAAKKVGVVENELSVAQLLKPASAGYLAWKENEAAKAAGVDITEVAEFEASFVKTPFGAWIVRLDRLITRQGRTIPIDDGEWRKVTPPGEGR